jgi:uncharacterized protein (DUF2345 family)
MRLMASKGMVEIEAQSNAMNVIAEQKLTMFSTQNSVHISAPQEILLTAGDSYIKINGSGIEQGTNGAWRCHAASHKMVGPKTMPYLNKEWQSGEVKQNARAIVRDELGRLIPLEGQATLGSEAIKAEEKLHPLYLYHNSPAKEFNVQPIEVADMQCVQTFSPSVDLTKERNVESSATPDSEGT